jgi:hypothetical protein
MNKLELKNIDFGAEDLFSYRPEILDNFCIWLTLSIGATSRDGSTLFSVGICTSNWLKSQMTSQKIMPLRHLLLVEKYDYEAIKVAIIEIINNAQRETIEESYCVLAKSFAWEFEAYQV